jgi:hypothetical protein
MDARGSHSHSVSGLLLVESPPLTSSLANLGSAIGLTYVLISLRTAKAGQVCCMAHTSLVKVTDYVAEPRPVDLHLGKSCTAAECGSS